MAVRMNLSIGEDLDNWINEKAKEIGIAKNAYVIMCVANARMQEENMKMMNNEVIFNAISQMIESEKEE